MRVLRRCCLRLRAVARGHIGFPTLLTFAIAIALAAFAGIGIQGAGATPVTCSSVGVTVAPLHGTRFYIDAGASPVLDSGYTGVSISPSAAQTNIWVKLSGFAGGELGLDANQPSAFPLGDLTGGSTTPAYFFLTASPAADLATAQTFNVDVYQGDPAHGGTQLCSYADGYSGGVSDTIQASANKVQDVTGDSISSSVSNASPVIGGTITLTVEGTTGSLGAGPDGTPFIYETPTSIASWPAGSFRLVGTTLTLSPGASQTVYTNQLQISNSTWAAAQDYIARYTFQITGTTSSATTPYPIQEISSGTQVKHTNTSSLASIPAIQPASNTLTVTHTVSPTSLASSGGTVDYSVVLHSSSSTSAAVDEIVDTLPASATYRTGTAKLDGTTIADPTLSAGTLVFPGPFNVSTSADRTLTFSATLPASAGTYTNSVVGYIASTQIDTTTSTSDSAPSTASATVAGTAQTISFTQPADTRVDQGPVALSASASSGLAVSFASSTAGVCTVSGSSVTLVSVGTCTIAASQAGNGTYTAASSVSRSFQVTAAPLSQSITFAQPADTRVDQGPVSASASASSGLAVSLASTTTGICTVAGSSIALVATGTCTITASQSGNGTYAAASPVARSFQVTAAPITQTISFSGPPSTAADQGPVTAVATATSALAVAFTSSTTGVCAVSGSTVTLLAVGTCTLTASQGGNATYAAAIPVTRSFAITAVAQTISFAQPADVRVDHGPVSLSASASSALGVSFAGSTPSVCTVSGSSVTLVSVGTCTITASQAGTATYAAATSVVHSFAVTAVPGPGAQSITFPQPGDTRVDQGPVSLGASASSGLAVSYTSSTTGVCTISGSSVTLVAIGTCTIVASQAGDSTRAAAADMTRSFAVTSTPVAAPVAPVTTPAAQAPTPVSAGRAPQAILFAPLPPTGLGSGPIALAASATSSLGVSYASATPSICSVSPGGSVTVIAAGLCTVVARQGGDGGWLPAPDARESFAVTAPSLPEPTSTPATTVAGKTTQSVIGGIPVGATVALDGVVHVPGVAAAHIVGSHVIVTPAKTFSGIVQIPIVVTSGGRLVTTTVPVVVRPAAPTQIAVTPKSASETRIAWRPSASATGYVVRVAGKVVCRTTSTGCDVPILLGPNDRVDVTSDGHAGTRSDDAAAAYAADQPVLIAIVHFASGSSTLEQLAQTILDDTQAKIARGGYTHAMLTCHTDNVGSLPYNMALSAARCASVADYVKRQLGISHVTYRQADFAFLKPTAPNSTPQGMAKNRRVEVYVR